MGLFEKKDKKTWTEKEPCIVKCPNCGREHTLAVFDCKWRLDGTPAMPTSEYTKCFRVCECGMLIAKIDFNPNAMQLEEYQDALKEPNDIVRIWKLVYVLNGHDAHALIQIANHYREQEQYSKEREYLCKAIESMKIGGNETWEDIYEGQFNACKIRHSITVMGVHHLIDAYRRAACWDSALQLIQQERSREYYADPSDIMRWLKQEERLIKARDTTPQ